jgi:hypothetical protein
MQPSTQHAPATPHTDPFPDLTTPQIEAILADVRFSRDRGMQPEEVTQRYAHLVTRAEEWQQEQRRHEMTVYPAVPAVPAPYTGPGVSPLQQVLLPDGRVVTGYAMTQAAPPATQPVVVERRGGIDPGAQKLAGAGVLAVGVGYGGSLLFSALAAAESALGALAVCLVIGWAMRGRGGGGGGSVRVDVRVTQNPTITTTSRIERK